MPPASSRRRGGGKKFTVLFVTILIIAVCAIIYIAFMPSKDDEVPAPVPAETAEDESSMKLDIADVNEIDIELRTHESTAPAETADTVDSMDDDARLRSIFREYVVQGSDTINSISIVSGISPQTIAGVNSITDMTVVRDGMILYIPPMDGQVHTIREGEELSDVIGRFNPEITIEEVCAINDISAEDIGNVKKVFIPSYEVDDAYDGILFTRPAEGVVRHGFGEVYDDRKLDGIAIEVVPGSAISSIASGFVADVGADPVYGRYVTVIHDNGYKSYYYSLETVAVRIGDNLEQGAIIGSVGTSSRHFGSPCLFFKLEQGPLQLDPMLFL